MTVSAALRAQIDQQFAGCKGIVTRAVDLFRRNRTTADLAEVLAAMSRDIATLDPDTRTALAVTAIAMLAEQTNEAGR